ncbi:MAG: translocation/assembly module TamB domain-containing protein [Bacteroidetes bacterium]|nr:translocation/assembly module TamB domain-containing protein [Bacteroidota bacterium]
MRKKLVRIFLWVLAIFLLLIGTMFILLQAESVQTWLAQRAAAYLSDQLKTKVTIGSVSIQFVEKVSLKYLYIEDLHHNTLLYAEDLTINISDLSIKNHKLDISKTKLSHAKFSLMKYKGEAHDNLHFISEYFASKDTTASGKPWKINISDVRLDDVTFHHDVEENVPDPNGVDFSHLDVTHISGDLQDISFVNDSIFVNINKLQFKDRSGFELDELSADAKVANDEMRLKNLVIKTPYTDLHTDLTFKYRDLSAFDEFVDSMNFNSGFKHSAVSFTDIAFFAPDLKGMSNVVKLDGNFKGTVNRFKGKNVTIEFGERSFFKGNITMNGLPEINETYMDVLADDVDVNKKDVESIPLPPFKEHQHVVIPENMAVLGNVNFKGKFTGFFLDFVAFGNITTDIGFISTDINMKFDKEKKTTVYNGHLSTNHFDVGQLIENNDLGKLTMNADVKGQGLKLDKLDATLNGTIDALEFRKYTYRNMKVNGEVARKLFNGSFAIHEPNIDLDFTGAVDYTKAVPGFDFTANVGKAHLDTLNLFAYRGEEELKTKIVSHFSGNKIDNLEGSIEIDNTDFHYEKTLYHINHIGIRGVNNEASKSITVNSDNVDAAFNGRFEFATLGDAFRQIMPKYLPAVILPVKSIASNQDFTFNIRLKNMSVITENFFSSWWVEPNTIVSGRMNSMADDLVLKIESPLIRYKNFSFHQALLNCTADHEKMKLNFSSDQLYYSDSSNIASPRLTAETSGNKVSFLLQLADSASHPERANLPGEINFYSASKFDVHFNKPGIFIENREWTMNENNKVVFDTSAIHVSDFILSKGDEQINIGGNVSKNENDRLSVSFANFNLEHLNFLLQSSSVSLGGWLTGSSAISDVYHKVRLVSNLDVKKIRFNADTLGNASFITNFDDELKLISVNANIQNGTVKTVSVSGNYHTNYENNNLEFDVQLNNFYLNTIGKYIDDVVSDLNGRASASLKLTGSFQKPVFTGMVNLNRVRCKVNYLNTRYNFTNDVIIGENYFELKNFIINDEKSDEAVANGRISHEYFKNFFFQVNVDAKRFQCLNTVASQNSIYYGIANASGSAYFSGPLESMNMQIQFASEKGTQISIPLSTTSEIGKSDYITFREKGKFTNFSSFTNRVNLSGVKLDMSLEVTPDAEIQLIFDEKIGDKIIGNGNGNLRLDINTIGDFNMYGNFEIMNGSYLFTLQNIINKKFAIEKGSSITWGGNPYDADINLDATYTTKTATLYKLLPDSSYRTSLYVDCKLNLSNKLMNPTIKYSINVRGLDPGAESQIKSLLNSEAEVSKQMFGLLVLNQFIPQQNTTQSANRIDAAAGAGATGYEFLTDQVNNWLSQISTDVNIGVNYKAKDLYSKEEYQLMFSKSLANDRLLIEGNVGVIGTTAADQSTSNIVGDFNAEYKLNEDGRFRIKAFNKSNTSSLVYNYAPYTQGFGVFYREEFNTFRELLERYKILRKREVVKSPASMN